MNRLLIFCSFLLSFSFIGNAQDNAPQSEIKKIRELFHTVNDSIEMYDRLQVNDTLTAWYRGLLPYKMTLTHRNGTTDYYYNKQGQLRFIFEQLDSKENRYYFAYQKIESFVTIDDFPVLIRWIDSEKNFRTTKDEAFAETAFRQVETAAAIYFAAVFSRKFSDDKYIELKEITENGNELVALLDAKTGFVTDTLNDNLFSRETEDDGAFSCIDEEIFYRDTITKKLFKKTDEEWCDGGHVFWNKRIKKDYYGESGFAVRRDVFDFHGSSERIYDTDITTFSSVNTIYSVNRQEKIKTETLNFGGCVYKINIIPD